MNFHEHYSNASTAEAFAAWLARPIDLQDDEEHTQKLQLLRNDANERFDLF
jgi:hypothetical protein